MSTKLIYLEYRLYCISLSYHMVQEQFCPPEVVLDLGVLGHFCPHFESEQVLNCFKYFLTYILGQNVPKLR